MPEGSEPRGSVCVAFGLGCSRAQVDLARIDRYFRANEWDVIDRLEDAELVVVMSCGFCKDSEVRSLDILQATDRRRRAASRLVIVGCLAGINGTMLHESFDAVVIAPKNIADLDAVIGATVPFWAVDDPNDIQSVVDTASRIFTEEERRGIEAPVRAGVRKAIGGLGVKRLLKPEEHAPSDVGGGNAARPFSLRVATGCMGECTYCAIRFACGPLQSKPLDKVLAEFDTGLRQGYREFHLIAQDLAAYGQDLGLSIVDLLRGMFERPGEYRLHLIDFDPMWLIAYRSELVPLLADNRRHVAALLVPIQSGSERVLQLMRRGHSLHDAREALLDLRAACPDAELSTHVLVGFPGETDRDFQDSLDFLRAVRFDAVTPYGYEDRPGTPALLMQGKVPSKTIDRRITRCRRQTDGLRSAVLGRVSGWGLRRASDVAASQSQSAEAARVGCRNAL